jgi:primosomal protein N' (replication factor Y)
VGAHAAARRPQVGAGHLNDRVARVVVDEPALEKPFDYLVPEHLGDQVRVGSLVRVPLHGRRVGGWVRELDVEPPAGVALKPIAKVTGWGPAPELFELAEWAARRWAGRLPHFLRTASPSAAVQGLPSAEVVTDVPVGPVDPLMGEALRRKRSVLRLPPSADAYPLVLAAAALGPTLVVAPAHATAQLLASRLRRAGVPVALLPREWARAAAGTRVVIGARAAAWAPVPDLAAVIVLDEHEEVHQEEASPTWNARDVAAERARRAGVPCVLTSPSPSLEALAWGDVLAPDRSTERAAWPIVDVVDRAREDPLRTDLYSPKLVDLVRSGKRVVCVLNRKGRARLLACGSCGDLARCDRCGLTVAMDDDVLQCRACAATRPAVCLNCGSSKLKVRRLGTTRAREDLERLAGVPVGEVTGDTDALPDASVLVGTEAVLRRVDHADAVAFLDLDAELLAPRYRAAEQTMALVARAARLVGGKAGGGRLLLQTRLPRHEVVLAALHGDPARVAAAEAARREPLGWPPYRAMAHVSGTPAAEYVAALQGVQVMGPVDGAFLVRARDHETLADALAAVPRPPGRLRVAVDPLRL